MDFCGSPSALVVVPSRKRAGLLPENLQQRRKELRWVAKEMDALELCALFIVKGIITRKKTAAAQRPDPVDIFTPLLR